VPSEQVLEKYRVENINIKNWIDNGIVTAINGATINYEHIIQDIKNDNEKINIIELAYDKWQSNKLIDNLEEFLPKTVLIQYDQSIRQMSSPSKEYERFILEDKIIDNSPVMKWMLSNAVIKPDVNGNIKPLKEYKSSPKRIDGVITSIMAIDRCNANQNSVLDGKDFNNILKLF